MERNLVTECQQALWDWVNVAQRITSTLWLTNFQRLEPSLAKARLPLRIKPRIQNFSTSTFHQHPSRSHLTFKFLSFYLCVLVPCSQRPGKVSTAREILLSEISDLHCSQWEIPWKEKEGKSQIWSEESRRGDRIKTTHKECVSLALFLPLPPSHPHYHKEHLQHS